MASSAPITDPSASRDRILDAAEALFGAHGFGAVGMSEVAKSAGVAKSAVFYHFDGKLGLYCEVLIRAMRTLERHLAPVLELDCAVDEQLDRFVDAAIDGMVEVRAAAGLMLRVLFDEQLMPIGSNSAPQVQPVYALLERLIGINFAFVEQGIERGGFRKMSSAHAFQNLYGTIIFHFVSGDFGSQLLGRSIWDDDAVAERRAEVKALLRGGMLARN